MAKNNTIALIGLAVIGVGIIAGLSGGSSVKQPEKPILPPPPGQGVVGISVRKNNPSLHRLSNASIEIKDGLGAVVKSAVTDGEFDDSFTLTDGNYSYKVTHSVYGEKTGIFVVNSDVQSIPVIMDTPACSPGQTWNYDTDMCESDPVFEVRFVTRKNCNGAILEEASIDVTGTQSASGITDVNGALTLNLPPGSYSYTSTRQPYLNASGVFDITSQSINRLINHDPPSCLSGQQWNCVSDVCESVQTTCTFTMICREFDVANNHPFLDESHPLIGASNGGNRCVLIVQDTALNVITQVADDNWDAIISVQLPAGDYIMTLDAVGFMAEEDFHTHVCPDGTARTFRLTRN